MKIFSAIWNLVISLIIFLLYWVFLPIWCIVGLGYYKAKGKISKNKNSMKDVDIKFLEGLQFKLDESEWKWMQIIIKKLRV